MSEWKLKRFWTDVTLDEGAEGFAVLLDGRGVKTPAKAALAVPTRVMAEAIAAEWAAVEGEIDPLAMPFTRTANAAIDKVVVQFDEVAQMLADYAGTDLLCYRADSPEELVTRQSAGWDAPLAWAAEKKGLALKASAGVMPHKQSDEALARSLEITRGMTPFQLTAFHDLVSLTGSFILGLYAAEMPDSAANIWDLSRIDEHWQAEQWGDDDEALALEALKREQFLHAKAVWDAVVYNESSA